MDPYEELYERKCRTPLSWKKLRQKLKLRENEAKLKGTDFIRQIEQKVKIIKERLEGTTDRQKSHADLKRKDIDKVFLKVTPRKKC